MLRWGISVAGQNLGEVRPAEKLRLTLGAKKAGSAAPENDRWVVKDYTR